MRTYALAGVALAVNLMIGGATLAHPGGLNAEGCHNNRKTGDYHCHGGKKSAAKRSAPKPQSLSSDGTVYYANCSAARAAGAAPLRRGEPGYRPALDRDGDGVACE
ncbi:MAG: excalibur calcium-binding domain-containing protein [Caulobacter sp.]